MSPQTVKEILKSNAHFFEKGDAVAKYQTMWGLSDREVSNKIGISKSGINRMNTVAKCPGLLRTVIIQNDLTFHAAYLVLIAPAEFKEALKQAVFEGRIKTPKQVSEFIKNSKDPFRQKFFKEMNRIVNKYNNQVAG